MEEYLKMCLKNTEEEQVTKSSVDRPSLSQGLSSSLLDLRKVIVTSVLEFRSVFQTGNLIFAGAVNNS